MLSSRPAVSRRRIATSVAVCIALTAALFVSTLGTAAARTTTASKTKCTKTSGEPILLSQIGNLEGPAANPTIVDGALAAVKAANCDGGVQGRPLKLITCNGSVFMDPNLGPDCARDAVAKGVVASVGRVTADNVVVQTFADAGIPSVDSGTSATRALVSPMSFPMNSGVIGILAGLAAKFYDDGARNIRVMVVDSPGAAAIGDYANKGLASRGASVLPPILYPADPSVDDSAIIQSALAGGTDAIELLLGKDQIEKVVPELRAAGFKGMLGGGTTVLTDPKQKAIQEKGFVLMGSLYPATATSQPAVKQFNADMARFNPKGEKTDASLATWGAVEIVVDALKTSATIDGPGLAAALAKYNVTLGLSPEFCFCDGGNVYGIPRIFTPYVQPQKIKNGKYVVDGEPFDPTAPPASKSTGTTTKKS